MGVSLGREQILPLLLPLPSISLPAGLFQAGLVTAKAALEGKVAESARRSAAEKAGA